VIRIALALSIVLGMGSLAWGFATEGFDPVSRALLIFGAAWLLSQWRGWDWFSSLGLFLAVLAAGLGLWIELDAGWMVTGVLFALLAWDLTGFRRRLRFITIEDDLRGLERRHLARLSLLTLGSLLLTSLAMILRLQFTFEWGALLVILIVLGLAQLVTWMRRQ
jgi:hypothetical protein